MLEVIPSPSRQRFFELLRNSQQNVFLCSPFIKTPIAKEIVKEKPTDIPIDVLTRCKLNDFAQGASDVEAIDEFLAHGMNVCNDPRLHAKVYIFDNKRAIVSSANLTPSGLLNNDEIGVLLDDEKAIDALLKQFVELIDPKQRISTAETDYFRRNMAKGSWGAFVDADGDELIDTQGDLSLLCDTLFSWERDVFEFISSKIPTEEFELKEVYAGAAWFAERHPNNNHVKDKIRQILQNLRGKGLIAFTSKGKYKKLWR